MRPRIHPAPLPTSQVAPPGIIRRDLVASTADGAAYSVMVGCGETYIGAYALAMGLSPLELGLLASVPLLGGALVQLVSPIAVRRLGTNRGWVIGCGLVQGAAFLPLAWWAVVGRVDTLPLFLAVGLYWAAGMSTTGAWNAWIGTLVPGRIRATYFARRNRLSQAGVLMSFVVAGLLLQAAESRGRVLDAFAVVFAVAAAARFLSIGFLARCRETERPERRPPRRLTLPQAIHALLTEPATSIVAMLWGMTAAAQFAGPYFTPFMLEELGFSYWTYMLVVAAGFLAKIVALPLHGRLAGRLGPRRLLTLAAIATVPLPLLWIPWSHPVYLVGVQLLAGGCWAAYELGICLVFFDAISHQERAGVVSAYNVGLATATVAGSGAGGLLLDGLGEGFAAYASLFTVSSLLRLAVVMLLGRRGSPTSQVEGNRDS